MSKVEIAVGGKFEQKASKQFVAAWHKAERGELVRERHVAFESWDGLARVLTVKRVELLRQVKRHPTASIRALANALQRDYSNVHADVQALAAAGLLELDSKGLHADYGSIETRIAI